MPIDPSSRYHLLPSYDARDARGMRHPTIAIRPAPEPPAGEPWFHIVAAGETLELLAHQYLGASEAWWVIADANPTVWPLDLPPGTRVRIPRPGRGAGTVQRTRSF
jgi:nucleoid-associated protein YgaU